MQPVYLISQANAIIYLFLIAIICLAMFGLGTWNGRRQERKQYEAPKTHV